MENAFNTDRFKKLEAELEGRFAKAKALCGQGNRDLADLEKSATDSRTRLSLQAFDPKTVKLNAAAVHNHVNGTAPAASPAPAPEPLPLPTPVPAPTKLTQAP